MVGNIHFTRPAKLLQRYHATRYGPDWYRHRVVKSDLHVAVTD